MGADYHQYIYDLENKKIIGDFEGAYKNCNDVYPTQHELNTLKHLAIRSYLEHLNQDHKRVLDIGCGYGDFVNCLSEKGVNVSGCEMSQTAVKIAKSRFPKAQIEVGDLVKGLRYGDGSFDIVLCLGVFGVLLDKTESCLKEIKRILKPKGDLFLSVYIPEDPIGKEHVKDYNDFYDKVSRIFQIKRAMMEIDHNDMLRGISLNECKDDMVFHCRKI